MQSSFLGFNLLEAQYILLLVEIIQAGALPLLIFLGIVLLQAADVLG